MTLRLLRTAKRSAALRLPATCPRYTGHGVECTSVASGVAARTVCPVSPVPPVDGTRVLLLLFSFLTVTFRFYLIAHNGTVVASINPRGIHIRYRAHWRLGLRS